MARYKSYARGGAPSPQQASSQAISQIDRETQRMVSALKEERDAAINNRNRMSDAMVRNQQIQSDAAAQNNRTALQNQQTIIDKQAAIKQRVMDEFNQANQANRELFGAVAEFSQGAAVKLQEMERERYIKSWNEDLERVLINGNEDPIVQRARERELAQEAQVAQLDGENLKGKVNGADELTTSDIAVQSTELSPGVQKGRMLKAARSWGTYVATFQGSFTAADGTTFTVQQAANDPVKMQQVLSRLLPEFLRHAGLEGVDPGVLYASGMLPQMMQQNQVMVNNAAEQKVADNKAQIKASVLDTFYVNGPASLVEGRRKLLAAGYSNSEINKTFDEAWTAQSTTANAITLEEYAASQTGPNSEPMGAARRLQLEQNFLTKQRQERANAEADLQAKKLEYLREALPQIRERVDGATTDDEKIGTVNELKADWQRRFPGATIPSQITELDREVTNKLSDQELKELQTAIITDSLTPEFIRTIASPSVRDKATQVYTTQQTSKYGPGYENVEKALRSKAQKIVGFQPTFAGQNTPEAQLMEGYLKQDLRARLARLTGPGGQYENQPELAVAEAVKEQDAEITRSVSDPSGLFYKDKDGNFVNLSSRIQRQVLSTNGRIYNTNKAIARGEDPFVQPDLVLPRADLQNLAKSLEAGGGFQMPQEVIALGKTMNMTPFQAFLKLLDGNGIQHNIGEALGFGINNVERRDPRTAALLSNIELTSLPAVTRAAATANGTVYSYTRNSVLQRSSQQIQEEGDAILQVAQRLGVNPADLASIISFETAGSFSPDQWGGEGGNYMGLIQFSPGNRTTYGVREGMTFAEQMLAVEQYFKDRFAVVGMSTQGATLLQLYTTVLAGNPKANINARDSFGTSASSGVSRMQAHREAVQRRYGF